jgi:hypothetical protein
MQLQSVLQLIKYRENFKADIKESKIFTENPFKMQTQTKVDLTKDSIFLKSLVEPTNH